MLGEGAVEGSWHGDKLSNEDIRGEASGSKHNIFASQESEGDMITTFRITQGFDRVDRGTWFQTGEREGDRRTR